MQLYLKKIILVLSFLVVVFSSCKTENNEADQKMYLRWIGDIEQNIEIDNIDFEVCNGDKNIIQYFNAAQGSMYIGEKSTLLQFFNTNYKIVKGINQDGLIRIRFIVNCKGKAGRFRILQSDDNYNEIEFDERIVSQLLKITKGIKKWEILSINKTPKDYYMYLIFKINNGQITEILP